VPQFKYSATGTYVIASQGTGTGPAGYQVTVTPRDAWVGSLVFKQNTAPNGATPVYVNVAYQNANTAEEVAAGTAITASAAIIISPTAGDLVVVYTHTAGEVLINVNPATQGVTNNELATAFTEAGFSVAGQDTPVAMLSAAMASQLRNPSSGIFEVSRNLRSVMDAAVPVGSLSSTILLQKIRTATYTEFAVFTPVSLNGIEWARWVFTNRFNEGLSGATRMVRCHRASLWDTTSVATNTENLTTGTEGQAATATQATGDATARVGSWTGPATVVGVTDIIYSTTIGDKATYTFTGCENISWRTVLGLSNGGIVNLTVKAAGVEISEANYYLIGSAGSHRIDLSSTTINAVQGQYLIPVAFDLNPATTYTLEVEVAATNPVSGRSYDGGIRLYDEIEYDATGYQSTFASAVVTAGTTPVTYFSGGRATYTFTGTAVSWKHITAPQGGIATCTVYSSGGTPIDAGFYVNQTIDTYAVDTQNLNTTLIAQGLPSATYFVVIQSSKTKNATSTGYRLYDAGINGIDQTVAGVVGTDPFYLNGYPVSLTSAVEGPQESWIAYGNLECAVSVRTEAEAPGDEIFVGGIHGYESAMGSLVFKKDGSSFDYAGGAALAQWTASTFEVSFTTTLLTPADNSAWATTAQTFRFGPFGYACEVTRTVTASRVVHNDYALMLNVPNREATNTGIGAGFDLSAVDGGDNYVTSDYDNGTTGVSTRGVGVVFYNDAYGVYGVNTNLSAYVQANRALDLDVAVVPSFLQDRNDRTVKYYNRAFRGDPTRGVTLQVGDAYTHRNLYRVFILSGLDALLR
jgi:hypothetical protein